MVGSNHRGYINGSSSPCPPSHEEGYHLKCSENGGFKGENLEFMKIAGKIRLEFLVERVEYFCRTYQFFRSYF